jgi:hypothetical protein
LDSSDVSAAAQMQKTRSIETPPQGQIVKQTETKSGKLAAPQRPIEPSGQITEKQLTARAEVAARTSVTGEKAIAKEEPAKQKAVAPKSPIKLFIEKWRRSWEKGDVQTYINCYHSGFTGRGMDIQAWEKYKKDLFNRTPKRVVQISDIEIKLDGAIATVTFKQQYKTKNYEGYGLKTLQLANHQGDWSILEESYESLPDDVMPAEVAIQSFVEKWRRAWEEGNLKTYIDCYHSEFETEKMDFQDWKNHKRSLFARSGKKNVQIRDLQIKPIGSNAVVTFTQSYQTATHRDLGIKTLHLRYDNDRWNILKENWQPLSGQG